MHRWIVYVPAWNDRAIPYYKLHIYHAEVMIARSFNEIQESISFEAREHAVTYVIAPIVLYRNFTQRVTELFREDYAHAYDLTATIGVDAFRDGRRPRKVKPATPWVVEWLSERWRGAGHIPRGGSMQALASLESGYRVTPLTSWERTSDCELDGYP